MEAALQSADSSAGDHFLNTLERYLIFVIIC